MRVYYALVYSYELGSTFAYYAPGLTKGNTMNDFDSELSELTRRETVPNGTYPTLTPSLRNHIKMLFVSGICENDTEIFQKLLKVAKNVDENTVYRYIQDKKVEEAWPLLREEFLQKQFERELADKAKLAEIIDEKYDRSFERIKRICDQQLEHLEVVSEMGLIDQKQLTIGKLTDAISKAYEAQRLARGLLQSNHGTVVKSEEAPEFLERLNKLEEFLEAKTVEAKPLKPV